MYPDKRRRRWTQKQVYVTQLAARRSPEPAGFVIPAATSLHTTAPPNDRANPDPAGPRRNHHPPLTEETGMLVMEICPVCGGLMRAGRDGIPWCAECQAAGDSAQEDRHVTDQPTPTPPPEPQPEHCPAALTYAGTVIACQRTDPHRIHEAHTGNHPIRWGNDDTQPE